MENKSSPVNQLRQIDTFLARFDPPVRAFEGEIRVTPFRVLISVLISSRTKDEVTLTASRNLFKAAATPAEMLALGEDRVAKLIHPVGFYRQKAGQIIKLCRLLGGNGAVPDSFEGLIALPGVGRKTANLVLSLAFNRPAIAVDTDVFRISRRLGWVRGETPEAVEEELTALFPREEWSRLNQVLVGFGQVVCKPLGPSCPICVLNGQCPHHLRIRDESGAGPA